MSGRASDGGWLPAIGLEVHCQLATRTKLFCGCKNEFGAPPNTLTCEVCTGAPGALPALNAAALALAVRAGLAVGAEIAPQSRFARKNYFYCDLPKGYQISQYERPLCTGGAVRLASGKEIRLTRIHLEEDAGKALHDRGPGTLVDLNRAGVPLIEAVSEPDLASPDEAYEYLIALKEILRYAGVSECDMEKGSLRCDVNVSVRRPDAPLGTKVEVKNLNSFRHVRDALVHEIARQVAAYESGVPERRPVQETRLWDPDAGETRAMRGKEHAHDYRYFPDPDLPPLVVAPELVRHERAALPEPAAARRRRYVAELGLSEYDAGVLTAERSASDYFERAAALAGDAKEVANWIANDLLRSGADLATLRAGPAALAELVQLVKRGTINRNAGRDVLKRMLASGEHAADIVRALGLEQVHAGGELESWCDAALAGNPAAVADVRAGRDKALGALIGAAMKASGGRANPGALRAELERRIRAGAR